MTQSYGILARNVKKRRMVEVQFLLGRHVEGTEAYLGYGAFGWAVTTVCFCGRSDRLKMGRTTSTQHRSVFVLIIKLLCLGLIENIKTFSGDPVAQWLRCCATIRKVADSIPTGVIGIFH